MLTFQINATSIQESNLFLRKLWSELNQIHPMGWNMYPYREKNRITIGISTLGEISFDYVKSNQVLLFISQEKTPDFGIQVGIQVRCFRFWYMFCSAVWIREGRSAAGPWAEPQVAEIFSGRERVSGGAWEKITRNSSPPRR